MSPRIHAHQRAPQGPWREAIKPAAPALTSQEANT